MVLLVMVAVVGVEGRLIPLTSELPVVSPDVPPRILFTVALPMVLPVIVTAAAAPEIFTPVMLPAIAAVTPELVSAPMVLF